MCRPAPGGQRTRAASGTARAGSRADSASRSRSQQPSTREPGHSCRRVRRRGQGFMVRSSIQRSPRRQWRNFNMNSLVAAHRTLPFGSILRVTNLNNGREVQVRVITADRSWATVFWTWRAPRPWPRYDRHRHGACTHRIAVRSHGRYGRFHGASRRLSRIAPTPKNCAPVCSRAINPFLFRTMMCHRDISTACS